MITSALGKKGKSMFCLEYVAWLRVLVHGQSELCARKRQRAEVAESAEHIDTESVLEWFADTRHHLREERSADEERNETEAVSAGNWRLMAPIADGEALLDARGTLDRSS